MTIANHIAVGHVHHAGLQIAFDHGDLRFTTFAMVFRLVWADQDIVEFDAL
ncbi:hypothetical protein D3C71_2049710 [compost metagenome]